MSAVEHIERQIQSLDDEAFAQLRQWFIEYDHAGGIDRLRPTRQRGN